MGSDTWTISPTVVNVATFGWTNFYNSLGLYSQGKVNDVAVIHGGIPGLQPGIPATWGIPSVSFSRTRTIFRRLATAPTVPMIPKTPITRINDSITWVHGKHSLDFGFTYGRQIFK